MGTERLIPGRSLVVALNRVLRRSLAKSSKPQQAPPSDNQTTVVQVPVPKDVGLDLTVVEGDGGTNIIGKKNATKPLVEVRDEKNELLEGAVVTFMAPADGPSVVFNNGLRTITVMTDADGRARAPGWRAVNTGPFQLAGFGHLSRSDGEHGCLGNQLRQCSGCEKRGTPARHSLQDKRTGYE